VLNEGEREDTGKENLETPAKDQTSGQQICSRWRKGGKGEGVAISMTQRKSEVNQDAKKRQEHSAACESKKRSSYEGKGNSLQSTYPKNEEKMATGEAAVRKRKVRGVTKTAGAARGSETQPSVN